MPILFAYGTLMEPRLLEGVLGHALEGIALVPMRAEGFRTVFYPGRIYPALVESPGAVTDGVAVAGLSARDMDILDLFEGDEYVRGEIEISLIPDQDIAGPSGDRKRPFLAMEAYQDRLKAQYYRPLAAISGAARPWSFAEWRRTHGEAMIVAEGETAAALRAKLIGMGGDGR